MLTISYCLMILHLKGGQEWCVMGRCIDWTQKKVRYQTVLTNAIQLSEKQ